VSAGLAPNPAKGEQTHFVGALVLLDVLLGTVGPSTTISSRFAQSLARMRPAPASMSDPVPRRAGV
jgi:hypothetical protein